MKNLLLIGLAVLMIVACNSTEDKAKKSADKNPLKVTDPLANLDPQYLEQDTVDAIFIPYNPSTMQWLGEDLKPTMFYMEDLDTLNFIIKVCVGNYNLEQVDHYNELTKEHPDAEYNIDDFVIRLSRYARQYVPYINKEGDRIVWINCFCLEAGEDIPGEVVQVKDGGNCYFSLKVNISKMEYFDFHVNGSA